MGCDHEGSTGMGANPVNVGTSGRGDTEDAPGGGYGLWPERVMNWAFFVVVVGFGALHGHVFWRILDLPAGTPPIDGRFSSTFITLESALTGFVAAVFLYLVGDVQSLARERMKLPYRKPNEPAEGEQKDLRVRGVTYRSLIGSAYWFVLDPARMRQALVVVTAVAYVTVAAIALWFAAIDTATPSFEEQMGLAMLGFVLPALVSILGLRWTVPTEISRAGLRPGNEPGR